VDVGPEVVSGSTRMKAGTAQKLVLNMLTTGTMTRLGKVYGNLMVNVHVKNDKLRERAISILMEATDKNRQAVSKALTEARNSVPVALIMLRTGLTRAQAEKRLKSAEGHVRQAITGIVPNAAKSVNRHKRR
jgi:N-acetylmuramic acid 6-phosphate etherase